MSLREMAEAPEIRERRRPRKAIALGLRNTRSSNKNSQRAMKQQKEAGRETLHGQRSQ
jgi:hypothetical protein